jgi:hypothetical protein
MRGDAAIPLNSCLSEPVYRLTNRWSWTQARVAKRLIVDIAGQMKDRGSDGPPCTFTSFTVSS